MPTEPRSPRLAVLIDADNASAKIADGLFEEIAKIGEASVRRIYGDFSSARSKGWAEVLSKHAIIPQQQFAYIAGKNASDITLVIDAMDLLHSGRFDGFCLVSSDFRSARGNIKNQQLGILRGTIAAPARYLATRDVNHPFEEKTMNKIVTGMLATALSVSFAAAAAMPASAAQMFVPQASYSSSNIIKVGEGGAQFLRHSGRHRHFSNRDFGNRNFSGRRFANNDGGYWNGHRGYREYHRGYRRHGDYWFPLAAFATGALITGAIVNSENNRYEGNSHVQWCYDHYRSYRSSDNTFQPNYGPRQECRSPY